MRPMSELGKLHVRSSAGRRAGAVLAETDGEGGWNGLAIGFSRRVQATAAKNNNSTRVSHDDAHGGRLDA
jgi:hypothetical protein